jgi:DNA-binding MarR family transcriptional regulator
MAHGPAPDRARGLSEAAEVGLLLRVAQRRAARAFAKALEPLGIEGKHMGVLLELGGGGPGSQRELIERTGGDKSSMVRIVDELERRGLAERRPAEHDRRAYAVSLTESGQALLAEARIIADRVGTELLAGLEPAERDSLRTLLRRFVAAG